jgi:hypothetical protein
MRYATLAIVLAGATFAQTVSAQQTASPVATMTDWSVFSEATPRGCWSVSIPKKSVATRDGRDVTREVRRGEIYLYTAYRPETGAKGEIAFTGGYPFAPGSTVKVEIGRNSFDLLTQEDWAWAANTEQDAALRDAMRAGEEAVITGRSSRGTVTRDTFSLRGFTAAMAEAERRCQ